MKCQISPPRGQHDYTVPGSLSSPTTKGRMNSGAVHPNRGCFEFKECGHIFCRSYARIMDLRPVVLEILLEKAVGLQPSDEEDHDCAEMISRYS